MEFMTFPQEAVNPDTEIFRRWHDKGYLRVCMANLYEKYQYGWGSSRITQDEWQRLLDGYRLITGEDYQI
jgi:hypothetical protein